MKGNKQSRRDAKQLFKSCQVDGQLDEDRVRKTVALLIEKKRVESYWTEKGGVFKPKGKGKGGKADEKKKTNKYCHHCAKFYGEKGLKNEKDYVIRSHNESDCKFKKMNAKQGSKGGVIKGNDKRPTKKKGQRHW